MTKFIMESERVHSSWMSSVSTRIMDDRDTLSSVSISSTLCEMWNVICAGLPLQCPKWRGPKIDSFFSPCSHLIRHTHVYVLSLSFSFFTRIKFMLWYTDPPLVILQLGPSLNPDDIEEGDDCYFECIIKANPPTYKVVWKHNVSTV